MLQGDQNVTLAMEQWFLQLEYLESSAICVKSPVSLAQLAACSNSFPACQGELCLSCPVAALSKAYRALS